MAADPFALVADDLSECDPEARMIMLGGRRRRLTLETGYWQNLAAVCAREGIPVAEMLSAVHQRRGRATLADAVRVFIVGYFRAATPPLSPQCRQ